jgi:nucleoside-diphosphate kinase
MGSQQTLSIVKPDAVAAGKAGAILQHFEDKGLKIIASKRTTLTQAMAQAFYAVHKERPFYSALVAFMTEGPIFVSVLQAENAVDYHRTVMGATDPAQAEPGTVRALFGTNIERNACHGSDSPENAAKEVSFFFSASELL